MRKARPRASMAHRYVDSYVEEIAAQSRPLRRLRLLVAMVTASFFAHFVFVFGQYLFGARPARVADEARAEASSPMKIRTDAKHVDPKKWQELHDQLAKAAELMKQLAVAEKKVQEDAKKEAAEKKEAEKKAAEKPPEPAKKPEEKKAEKKDDAASKKEQKLQNESVAEKAKNDAEARRKVLGLTEEQKKNAVKDAKKVGADNKNLTGVANKPKDEKLALQGLEKDTKEAPKTKPDPKDWKKDEAPAAKKPAEEKPFVAKVEPPKPKPAEPPKPVAMAAPEGEKHPTKSLVDPNQNLVFNTPPKTTGTIDPHATKLGEHAPRPRPAQTPAPKRAEPAPVTPPPGGGGGGAPELAHATPVPAPSVVQPASGENGGGGFVPPSPPTQPVPPPPAPQPVPPPPRPVPQVAQKPRPTAPVAARPVPRPNRFGYGPRPAPVPSPAPSPSALASDVKELTPGPAATPAPQAEALRPQPAPTVAPRPAPRPTPYSSYAGKQGLPPGAPGPRGAAPVAPRPRPTPVVASRPAPAPRGTPGLPVGPGHGRGPVGPGRAANEIKDLAQRDQVVNENLNSMEDFVPFNLDGGKPPEGVNVPAVLISNTGEGDWRDLVQHFDLCPIAYPDTKDYFVLIDIVNHSLQKADGEQAFHDLALRYAPNGIALSKRRLYSTPIFGPAAELVAQTYAIPEGQVNLMIVAPRQVMAYLAWKSIKVIKDEGYEPARVRAVKTHFSRTGDGSWVLTVTDLILADGTVHKVQQQ